jgi:hypothetical protein
MAHQLGVPPEPYVQALEKIINKNQHRVASWANEIHTPQDMLQKFRSWQARGII